MKRSYLMMRSNQISERGPAIGRCKGSTIYEWIRIAASPVRYQFAGLAPTPVPGTLFEPGKTILTVVIEPGLAYEPAV